jgi:hypothetical protein
MLSASLVHLPQVGDSTGVSQAYDSLKLAVPKTDSANIIGSPANLPTQVHTAKSETETVIQLNAGEREEVRSRYNPQEHTWNTTGDFLSDNPLTAIANKRQASLEARSFDLPENVKPFAAHADLRYLRIDDWLLGIFFVLTMLFIWIRVFYGKFFLLLSNAFVSTQIASKLFSEKNVVLRRVSFTLNFVYLIVLSLLIFKLIIYYRPEVIHISRFNFYLLLLNLTIFYAAIRTLVLLATGIIFMSQSIISEYIHNTYVVNKITGIVLFPVIIAAHYLPFRLVAVALILGIMIFAAAFIMKLIRGFQIIIRKDVLLFYLILYLCTLEILPVLIGYKVIITLI